MNRILSLSVHFTGILFAALVVLSSCRHHFEKTVSHGESAMMDSFAIVFPELAAQSNTEARKQTILLSQRVKDSLNYYTLLSYEIKCLYGENKIDSAISTARQVMHFCTT